MLDEFERIAGEIAFATPVIPVISNLTGAVAGPDSEDNALLDPAYWRRHARETVRFAQGIQSAVAQGYRVFLEIGPSPTLLGMARRAVAVDDAVWIPSLRRGRGDWQQILEGVGALHVAGVTVDLAALDRQYTRRKLALPTYPFERQRFWIETAASAAPAASASMDDVVAAGTRQSQQAPFDLALHTYADRWAALDRLTIAAIVGAFHRFGVFAKTGDRQSVEALARTHAIAPAYRPLLGRWLDRLAGQGLLAEQGDGTFVATEALVPVAPNSVAADAAALGDLPALRDYLLRSSAALVDVVTGRTPAIETLFPGGSLETADGLFASAGARYVNGIIAALTGEFLRNRGGHGTSLRVLEVGAGTGATAEALLPILPKGRSTYWFTDLFQPFLDRAAARFDGNSTIRTGRLDIDADPVSQGYPSHAFDVVIATDVLHAARSVKAALEHATNLLAPGGLLVIAENTRHHAFFDVTTALIEGWDRFDGGYRADGAIPTGAEWQQALADAGFEGITAFPQSGSPAEALGQHVIVARAPQHLEAADAADELLARLDTRTAKNAAAEEAEQFVARVIDALPLEREELLTGYVRAHVARVLKLGADEAPDRRSRLMDLGLDSLMAVELRNRLAAGLRTADRKVDLPATLMFDYPTPERIAAHLEALLMSGVGRLRPSEASASPGPGSDSKPGAVTELSEARLAEMSEEEAEALLLERLERI
jgi:SAM-dependent methyltransferase